MKSVAAFAQQQQQVYAGMLLHEVIEFALVRNLQMEGEGTRWFNEGVANYLSWRLLKQHLGPEAAQTFRAAYAVESHQDKWQSGLLSGWSKLEANRPNDPLLEARYAWATERIFNLSSDHGENCIPELIREIADLPRTERTAEALNEQLSRLSDTDWSDNL